MGSAISLQDGELLDVQELWNDSEYSLSRGRQVGGKSVLIIAPNAGQRRPRAYLRLEHEFELRDYLNDEWAAVPLELLRDGDRPRLILSDGGGEPISLTTGQTLSVDNFLNIALASARALQHLHVTGLVHQDIKPPHILFDPASSRAWLTGFGFTSRPSVDVQLKERQGGFEGTLAYMAPEQTGYTDRPVDVRSDLYALGATLYELLAGAPPFQASDTMQLIHAHIAQSPRKLIELVVDLPEAISAVISKLLAKDPSERYQSVSGLLPDLERCLTSWVASRAIPLFELGRYDAPKQLLLRHQLYGRTDEINRLTAALERVKTTGAPELIVVSGYSGIGKSALVAQLRERLGGAGRFLSGKFDQYKRNIPYAPLADAMQGLVRSILGKDAAELRQWSVELADALGVNGQVIVNLVPELAYVIGDQAPLADLSGPETRARNLLLLSRFLGVFARPQHPLVLFVDDLQWMDAATLDVFQHLATRAQVQHLLLIGAYRDNEVTPEHPLASCLEAIRSAGAPMQEIALSNLRLDDVTSLLTDSLNIDSDAIKPLADCVIQKTGGNPFFTTQFVAAVADQGLLTYEPDASGWHWDLAQIQAKEVGDSVVDLMIERLGRVTTEVLSVLQHMACIGSRTDLDTLSIVLDRSAQGVRDLLSEPLRTGLVLVLEDELAFAHDRVQEAVYALLSEADRVAIHDRVGSRLLSELPEIDLDERIFDIVNQFGWCGVQAVHPTKRTAVARLNLRAARKAKASAAYGSAINYLAFGRALAGESAWSTDYELAFALALEEAECLFLSVDFHATAIAVEQLLANAANKLDKATTYRLQVELFSVQAQFSEAIKAGLAGLRLFGIDFPEHPERRQIDQEYSDVWSNLGDRPVQHLTEMPAMTDPEMLVIMRLSVEMQPPAYFTDFHLNALIICRMVNITIRYGIASTSSQGLALFGWIMGPAFADFHRGYPIALVAWQLATTRGAPVYQARTCDIIGLTSSWTQPAEDTASWWRKAHQSCVQAGDVFYSCYPAMHVALHLFLSGRYLPDLAHECSTYLKFAQSTGFAGGARMLISTERAIASLQGHTRGLTCFDDDQFDEREFEASLAEERINIVAWYYWIRKMMLYVLSGNHEAALEASSKVKEGTYYKVTQFAHSEYHFYSALALCDALSVSSDALSDVRREQLWAHYLQIKTWAEQTNSPLLQDKSALISAEITRLDGHISQAESLYEDSIQLARQSGVLQTEAIACERAARCYAQRNLLTVAHAYLRMARDAYRRWGAEAKVRQLDAAHPEIGQDQCVGLPTSTTTTPVEQLDLGTVIKVAQTLTGEVVLEKLIEALMHTAIEHAGAERAVLVLTRGAEHVVVAEARTTDQGVSANPRNGLGAEIDAPHSVLQYVLRTKETVLLSDALTQNSFPDDAFIRSNRVRSLLAVPLMNQGRLAGIISLENNLAPNVFTPSRTAVLKLIASQAAIALENTRLYRDLEEREARIRRLVDSNIVGIVIWDLDGRLLDANDAFLRMVQYDREDLKAGMRWFDMTPPEWQEAHVHEEAEELKATGMLQVREKEYFRKDGSRVPVLIGAATFDGQPHQGVAYILDLTERKRAEEAARRSEQRYRQVQSELAHANRVATVGQLSAAISHDVRQPLVGVVTSASAGLNWLAADPPNIGAARRALERVVREGHRAAEVLDRTRALVKKVPPKTQMVGINDVISDAVVVIGAEAVQRNVALQIELEDDLPPVLADRVQLQQVILNLIINAIEAMSTVDGRRELTVVSGKDPQDLIYVAVRDTGPGVPQELHSKLFDAFYSTKSDGMGMGLAISRTIVEAHGGRVWVSSNEPRGSIFWFSLPTGGEDARSSTIARSTPSAD
jgi:PAS domain S-box-containing protein